MAQLLMKRHARLEHEAGPLLWVGDEPNWAVMRGEPRPVLLCPQPGCSQVLHAVCNARGTRFLRRHGDRSTCRGSSCDHWWVTGSAGGAESDRHLWLKARLAAICLHLGWQALPEDPITFADVWVPDAQLALEVQLRRTDTLGRTRARFQAGAATVVWFIAADVPAAATLFHAPAVRFDVVGAESGAVRAAPWRAPSQASRLVVFGTIWRWADWRLVTGAMSAYRFLAQLLAGQLGWCPPGTPGLPRGRSGWVRWADLALAMGLPDESAAQVQSRLPLGAAGWIDAQWQRRSRPGRGPSAARAGRGP